MSDSSAPTSTQKVLEPGFFCWIDVAVSDPTATHKFFTDLFGWGRKVRPTEDAHAYSIMTCQGQHVAGICQVEEAGPSQWMSYLLVDDLSQATDKAESLGAEILKRDIEIDTFGTMTVVQDPTGAIFALWQSKRGESPPPLGHGTFCGNELITTDLAKATAFYSALAGWTTKPASLGDLDYTFFQKDGEMVCGMMSTEDSTVTKNSTWLVHFSVDNAVESVHLCKDLGGDVKEEPVEIEGLGQCALLQDPSGGVFGIVQSNKA